MAKPDPALLEVDRYPVTLEVATRFQDLDPNKHVNNVALAAIFEEIRVRFDSQLGLFEYVRRTGMRTMVASLQMEFLNEAFYPEPIKAHVGTLSMGRSSWTVAALAVQGSKPVSFMRATIVNTDQNGASPIPEQFRDLLDGHAIRLDAPAKI